MSQISENLENMINEHSVQEVEVKGDATLFQICEEFGAQDAYSHLIAVGITSSLLQDLTEEDVNAILPVGATRTIFRREWRRWCRDLPEASDKIGEKRSEPRKQCEKRVWTSVELQDILNCPDGQKLKQMSATLTQKGSSFERRHKKTLVRVILDYASANSIHLSTELMAHISEEIETFFPHEKKETYYKPKSKLNPSYKGMLYDKYHNNKKEPGKKKSKSRKNTDTTEAAVNSQETERSQDENPADVTDKTTVVMSPSDEMSFDMIRQWKTTSLDRIASITSSPQEDILVQWPMYSHKDGHKLIAADFQQLYPDAQNIDAKWSDFFHKIISFYEHNVKDQYCRSLYDDALGEIDTDKRQMLLLLALHAVIQPRNKIKIPAKNKVRCKKPSIADSQKSMLNRVTNEEDPKKKVQSFEKYLKSMERSFHPVIFYQEDTGEYVVYCTKKLFYNMSSVQAAVDVCFKAHHVFQSGTYPGESGSVWYFIQKLFFELVTEKDELYIGHCENVFDFYNSN
ncbi:uncharacterized protein DMENIID0001_164060 [Sergentomyia squamirostris]